MTALTLAKRTFFGLASAVLLATTLNGFAQTTQNSQTSAQATIPSTSAEFGLNLTACRFSFDWDTYFSELEAGTTDANPYLEQGCVAGQNVEFGEGDAYAALDIGQASTKAAFGEDPILGIYANQNYPAQSLNTYTEDGTTLVAIETAERNQASALPSIFSEQELQTIYSTGGERTAMPRIFSTGPDEYRTETDGQRVYRGGRCAVENGELFVRTERAGETFNPSLYGIDVEEPLEACARSVNGERLDEVEEQNLQVYQFVYEFAYPSAEQCQTYFEVDGETCATFFQNRYGRDLAGTISEHDRILSVYTYYGTFDDQYSQWVGWVNPDLNGPRADSEDEFIQAYDGYSVYAL